MKKIINPTGQYLTKIVKGQRIRRVFPNKKGSKFNIVAEGHILQKIRIKDPKYKGSDYEGAKIQWTDGSTSIEYIPHPYIQPESAEPLNLNQLNTKDPYSKDNGTQKCPYKKQSNKQFLKLALDSLEKKPKEIRMLCLDGKKLQTAKMALKFGIKKKNIFIPNNTQTYNDIAEENFNVFLMTLDHFIDKCHREKVTPFDIIYADTCGTWDRKQKNPLRQTIHKIFQYGLLMPSSMLAVTFTQRDPCATQSGEGTKHTQVSNMYSDLIKSSLSAGYDAVPFKNVFYYGSMVTIEWKITDRGLNIQKQQEAFRASYEAQKREERQLETKLRLEKEQWERALVEKQKQEEIQKQREKEEKLKDFLQKKQALEQALKKGISIVYGEYNQQVAKFISWDSTFRMVEIQWKPPLAKYKHYYENNYMIVPLTSLTIHTQCKTRKRKRRSFYAPIVSR